MINPPVKAGLLLPLVANSQYSKIFHGALQKSLAQEQSEVELIPVFCGRGELKSMVDGVDQLIDFYEVDIIIALSSYVGISTAFSKIKSTRVPLIVANLGEHLVPLNEEDIPEGYLVSLNWWQDAITLGQFAAQNFKEGVLIGSLFEVGYAFSRCFHFGGVEIDQDHHTKIITTSEELNNEELDNISEHLLENPPEYCFLLMEEACAIKFLTRLTEYDQLKGMVVQCLPHLYKPLTEKQQAFEVVTTNTTSGDRQLELTACFEELAKVVSQVMITKTEKATDQEIQSILPESNQIEISDLKGDNLSFSRTVMSSRADQNQLSHNSMIAEKIDLQGNKTLEGMRNAVVASWMNLYPFPS